MRDLLDGSLTRLRRGASRSCFAVLTLMFAIACTSDDAAMEDAGAGPSIVGSYQLASRDLPDGSTLEAPDIFGFMTFTEGYRHFHIHMTGADGQLTSNSYVAAYSLSETEYSETRQYAVNNEAGGAGVTYGFSGSATRSPVTVSEGSVEFPESEGTPILVFTEAGLTATSDGVFVDHWVRVE